MSEALPHEDTLARASGVASSLDPLERRMFALFEHSPVAVWVCDHEHVVHANRAAAQLFGVAGAQALHGRPVRDLLHADSHAVLEQQLARVFAAPESSAVLNAHLQRPDGEPREVEIALAALPDHGQRCVQMVVSDVTQRRREALRHERTRRALRELSASVLEAREEERRRIARELHDELGQRLTALKIDLAALATAARLPRGNARVAAMQATLDDTLASVRRIASDLRPLMLDDLGLTAAIEWLARDASQRTGVEVNATLPAEEPPLEPRVATALYRVVQEALTNVARHARAQHVRISLEVQGDAVQLSVADDGVGLREEDLHRPRSFGLLGLRERMAMLGGEFEIGQRPGGGTVLSVRVPARGHDRREEVP